MSQPRATILEWQGTQNKLFESPDNVGHEGEGPSAFSEEDITEASLNSNNPTLSYRPKW